MIPPSHYRLDSKDRIQFVDPRWLEFARDNDSSGLRRETVLGRPLWDFIAGAETRHLYERVFTAVRQDHRARDLPFRCDAPDRRRHMRLVVSPLEDDALDIEAHLDREETRPSVGLLEPGRPRNDELLKICSWCKQVLVSEDEWAEVEVAVERLHLFEADSLPQLTHGICEPCHSRMMADFESRPLD